MTSSAPMPAPPLGKERRRHVRVTFSPVRRPRLHLADGVHDVLDASLQGLRVRHASPARPPVGEQLTGRLEWPELDVGMAIAGTVVRVELTACALSCDPKQLPIAHILAEAARRRDASEGLQQEVP